MTRFLKLMGIVGLLLAYSCSGRMNGISPSPVSSEKKVFQIPAGVDSSVALAAMRKAERLFVDISRESYADTLFKTADDYLKITQDLYRGLDARKQALEEKRQQLRDLLKKKEAEGTQSLQDQRQQQKTLDQIQEDSLTVVIVTSLFDYYLDFCDQILHQGIELNPFDLRGWQYLGVCGWNRSVIFSDTIGYHQALQALLRILDFDRGIASIYKEIGKNYCRLKKWDRAYEFLSKAHKIYLITAAFDNPTATLPEQYAKLKLPPHIDPKLYYDLLFYKGQAEMWNYMADSALATFSLAQALAPTKDDADVINDYVQNWIKWDNGNIYAAEQRYIIEDSLRRGNFAWAKSAYLRLIPQLRTPRARHFITWRLARTEYDFLEQKQAAADRLYHLVMEADTSKGQASIYRPPADSLYKLYFKNAGEILYALGQEYMRQGIRDEARVCFAKDTTFEWAGRIKALLPLAQLVEVPVDLSPEARSKQRIEQMEKLFNRAKTFAHDLSDKEIDFLYGNLNQIYRTTRDQKKLQENYQEWQRLKAQRKP